MDARMKKYRQVSPERAKVWTEKSPKYYYNYDQYNQQKHHQNSNGKVPVIYYLCSNRQLEHPHFIEVPLSSPDGLCLRDVTERLNALRGRGMASMYSWSCKRGYKNGYVWHDLCDDDLILPAHGNEYVLKGSELFEEPNPGRFSPHPTILLQNQKALPEPPSSSRSQDECSSLSLNALTSINSQGDELMSSPVQRPCSSSPESSHGKKSSWNGSLSLTEYKTYVKTVGLADASTQTEEKGTTITENAENCTRGVSNDDDDYRLDHDNRVSNHSQISKFIETSNICPPFVSPPPSTPSISPSSGRTDTLEYLIRADAKKLNSFRILEEEEFRVRPSTRFKASNMILQLVSCGSISVKDHSYGLTPTYKPKFSHSKFSSPLFSSSLMLGEKEYFSGNLIEMSMVKQDLSTTLKRSPSHNDERSAQKLDSVENNEDDKSSSSKCIPRSVKASPNKQVTGESMRSPISEGPRNSSERYVRSARNVSACSPDNGSKRMTGGVKLSSCSVNEDENVITIEERLTSGARVIIQSTLSMDNGS